MRNLLYLIGFLLFACAAIVYFVFGIPVLAFILLYMGVLAILNRIIVGKQII